MKNARILLLAVSFSVLFSVHAFADWVPMENAQWGYEEAGSLLRNQWIEDQSNWYYLDGNGLMLKDTTANIDGVEYSFDAAGICVNPNGTNTVTWNTYTNSEIGFSVQIPSDVTTNAFDGNTETFDITASNLLISFYFEKIPENLDPETFVTYFELGFYESMKDELTYVDKSEVQLGGLTFQKTRYIHDGDINMDLYSCIRDNRLIVINAAYISATQDKTQEILNTVKGE